MIEAHTLDSWTRAAERRQTLFTDAIILGGFGGPIFLFLAGMAIALAAGSRVRRGAPIAHAAKETRRRGWQVFGLAFLFRLQALALSGGALGTLLKVDILNVMGVGMIAASTLWGAVRHDRSRILLLAAAAAGMTFLTPVVRSASWVAVLPDPVEWYLRPYPERTTFTLLPWAGFLFAGTAVGVWLDGARTADTERRVVLGLGLLGICLALAGYFAAYLPPMYAHTNFWTSSPTFFFLRLGVLLALVPVAYLIVHVMPTMNAWLVEFGRASLFVYWIHVEMVYGAVSAALHRSLRLEQALIAFVLFTAFLFGLVRLKARYGSRFGAAFRHRLSLERG